MPLEKWSDTLNVLHLADDPQFTDDMQSLEDHLAHHPGGAVLDLSAVHFINSSNLARLLKLRKSVHSVEGRLILCGISKQVLGTFHATGLDKVFDFAGDVPTALAMVQIE
jgi:anti-anti-sigma factor